MFSQKRDREEKRSESEDFLSEEVSEFPSFPSFPFFKKKKVKDKTNEYQKKPAIERS